MNFGISKELFDEAVEEFEDDLCPLCHGEEAPEGCGAVNCPYALSDGPESDLDDEALAEIAELRGRMQRV